MFFCRTARIVAILILILSVIQVGIALFLMPSDAEQMKAFAQHFGATSGKMIDRGVYGGLAAIALGALSEIGLKLKA